MNKTVNGNKAVNAAIVILGASGDLAKRKLIPALSKLYENKQIDPNSVIVGSGRSEFTDESFREHFGLPGEFSNRLHYHKGIPGLKKYIDSFGTFDRIVFFMALPPVAYGRTADELLREGFGSEANLIIEKPFGYDFESAHILNSELTECFAEHQIFRIDHYLAKEAVQNILVFRFANSIFYPVWNSRYIEFIQINAFEEIGVENRGAYFDNAGIIRDMVQNHLMQLLCLITMEAPVNLDPAEIQAQKINVLKTIRISDCCRFQYQGYHNEKGVADGSETETFAEMKLFIDNFRWTGMPVYIRAGKAMNRKGTEIGIKFKCIPKLLFNVDGQIAENKIIFKIQPSSGIIVDIQSKIPGDKLAIASTNMPFCYRESFNAEIPEAYQKLLYDALKGDRTLFVSAEETEIAWDKFGPFLDTGELQYYNKGSVPPLCIAPDWIDFESYASVCR
ncbi:glucose-6-phosphate dehydrogenase [Candidatus Latescibacterota bacterium]